jgi:beta-lactamase class C
MIAAVALYLGLRQSPEEPVAARPNPERAAAIAQAAKQPSVVDYARLDQRLNLLMEERDMVGLAVGVVEGGQIRFLKGYGETVEGNGQAVNPATLFRWASVSKGVAGAMVAKLADQNKVGLYEPIAKYSLSLRLPAGPSTAPAWPTCCRIGSACSAMPRIASSKTGMDVRALRMNLATLNLICPPGTCHAYQNVAMTRPAKWSRRSPASPIGCGARPAFPAARHDVGHHEHAGSC